MSVRHDVRPQGQTLDTPPDHALNQAIARVQLNDLAQFSRYPCPRGAAPGDAHFAFILYEQECIRAHNVAADGLVARRLQEEFDAEDARARHRRPTVNARPAQRAQQTRAQPARLQTTRRVDPHAAEVHISFPVPSPAPRVTEVRVSEEQYSCVICNDMHVKTNLFLAPCKDGHQYCFDCLNDLYTKASRDETLFPPRCCNEHLDYSKVESSLRPEVRAAFLAIQKEFSTKDRVYCPNKSCSTFLCSGAQLAEKHSQNGKYKVLLCLKCSTGFCTVCRGSQHQAGFVCRGDKDAAAQQVLQLGKDEGWQRCPGCSHMIELSQGCNHMSCRCGAQFCYVCTATWKQCACPAYDERRLFEAGQVHVARQYAGRPAANPDVARQRLEEAVRHINRVHDCQHPNGFQYSEGGGQCPVCQDNLPSHLFQCSQCEVRLCNRCRLNRGR